MPASQRAVVIEDDPDIRALIAEVLEQAGFLVFTAGTGFEGIELIREHDPQVTTLDVSLPGMDGFETARRIRAISSTYIVMLTARSDEIDTLQGLQSGADDYLVKPFPAAGAPRTRRGDAPAPADDRTGGSAEVAPSPAATETADSPTPPEAAGWLEHNGVRVHPDMRLTVSEGQNVDLTRSEFDIMVVLLEAGRRVVSKEELARELRGDVNGFVSEHDARAIEVHVANLRRKLGESPVKPRLIETIRGVGYRLTAPV